MGQGASKQGGKALMLRVRNDECPAMICTAQAADDASAYTRPHAQPRYRCILHDMSNAPRYDRDLAPALGGRMSHEILSAETQLAGLVGAGNDAALAAAMTGSRKPFSLRIRVDRRGAPWRRGGSPPTAPGEGRSSGGEAAIQVPGARQPEPAASSPTRSPGLATAPVPPPGGAQSSTSLVVVGHVQTEGCCASPMWYLQLLTETQALQEHTLEKPRPEHASPLVFRCTGCGQHSADGVVYSPLATVVTRLREGGACLMHKIAASRCRPCRAASRQAATASTGSPSPAPPQSVSPGAQQGSPQVGLPPAVLGESLAESSASTCVTANDDDGAAVPGGYASLPRSQGTDNSADDGRGRATAGVDHNNDNGESTPSSSRGHGTTSTAASGGPDRASVVEIDAAPPPAAASRDSLGSSRRRVVAPPTSGSRRKSRQVTPPPRSPVPSLTRSLAGSGSRPAGALPQIEAAVAILILPDARFAARVENAFISLKIPCVQCQADDLLAGQLHGISHVVIDVLCLGTSGLTVIERLRERGFVGGIMAVATSDTFGGAALAAGADAFATKSLSEVQLRVTLYDLVMPSSAAPCRQR